MIANFFNKTKPINFLVLSALLLVVYIISILFIFSGEFTFAYFIKKGFYLLMVLFMLFIFDFIIRKNSLTNDNSFALFFYVFLCGIFPFSLEETEILTANFFLLLSLRKIYSLRTPFNTKEKIFDSALWISVATLFYDWSIAFMILLYSAIFVFNKNSGRNFFIPLLGFFTPVFLFYVYLLAADKLILFSNFWNFEFSLDFGNYLQGTTLPMALLFIFLVVSLFYTTKKTLVSKLDFKATWIILIIQIALSISMALLAIEKNGSELSLLFFALSILFANYFQDLERHWLKELILYFFIVLYIGVYLV